MKIYDCFMFFNELDILAIRLNELKDLVHKFVLVEATRTFTNNPKPLYFAQHKEQFADFADKINHVVVEDLPATGTAWDREYSQRNAITRGLSCEDDDLILLSDTDEVPKPSVVRSFLRCTAPTTPVFFLSQSYYYSFRWRKRDTMPCTVAVTGAQLQRSSPQAFRDQRHVTPRIADAGWHFRHFGGVNRLIYKIESFAHQEFNTLVHKDPQALRHVIQEGRDIFNPGKEHDLVAVQDWDCLPEYVVTNWQKFRDLLPAIR